MKITYVTLFPDFLQAYFEHSLFQRAVGKGVVTPSIVALRDFGLGPRKNCDSPPYGGGAGMLMSAVPLATALRSIDGWEEASVVFPSPQGEIFTQERAVGFTKIEHLIIICGHYEGVDQRFIDKYVDHEICLGNFVMSSGELAAMTMTDAVFRLLPGALSEPSLDEESFSTGLVEYPQYTRPEVFEGRRVPSVLLSGHHARIAEWRKREALAKTLERRPDLATAAVLRRASLLLRENEKLK